MSNAADYLKYAELSLASYSDLIPGAPAISKLVDSGRGMSTA